MAIKYHMDMDMGSPRVNFPPVFISLVFWVGNKPINCSMRWTAAGQQKHRIDLTGVAKKILSVSLQDKWV